MSFIPFTTIRIAEAEKKADGNIRLVGVEMDPDKLEAETKLLNNIIDKLSAPAESVAPTAQPVVEPPKKLQLSDAIQKFIAEKQSLEPKSLYYRNDVPKHLALLLRVVGDQPVDAIKRDVAFEYFDTLKKLPKNLNKDPLLRDKTIGQILKLGLPPREASTINGAIIAASALWCWLKQYDEVNQDYFNGLRVPRKKGGRDRFDDSELTKLFSTEVFTAHTVKYAWHYWMPLIGLHTGMRMNEILQLRPSDIREHDGILVLNVAEDTEEMSVKTDAGLRTVPIHPTLIQLGFKEFIDSRRREEWIFEELTLGKDGRRSAKASKWFSAYRTKLGLGKGKDFHSLRHTVIDDLKQMKENAFVIKAIVGHADGLPNDDITMNRYGKNYQPETLKKTICKLDYTAVLANVKPWPSPRVR